MGRVQQNWIPQQNCPVVDGSDLQVLDAPVVPCVAVRALEGPATD